MATLSPIEKVRATSVQEAIKHSAALESYIQKRGVTIYGVHPEGVLYASAFATVLGLKRKDIMVDTYSIGNEFERDRVHKRRTIVVKESVESDGAETIARKAAEAALRDYMDPNDFRLLIVHPFSMLTIEDLYPEFGDLYRAHNEEKSKPSNPEGEKQEPGVAK